MNPLVYLQPIPEEWEALFIAGGAVAFIAGLAAFGKWRALCQRHTLSLAALTIAALVGLSVLNQHYLHRFMPDAANPQAQPAVLPEPFFRCAALRDYRAALDDYEALSADEWRRALYAPSCRSATIATVIALAAAFWATLLLIALFFARGCASLRKRSPALLKTLLALAKGSSAT